MGRSLKKGPYVDFKVYRKVQQQLESGSKEAIKTWARACTIVPEFVGVTFLVHNGKNHVKVFVTEDMVGLFSDYTPKFVKRYAELGADLEAAAQAYARDVRARAFPGPEHCFDASPTAANLKAGAAS